MKERKILTHCPLPPLKERYTEFLHSWEKEAFGKSRYLIQVWPYKGAGKTETIQSGEVLDAIQWPLWALEQIRRLFRLGVDLGDVYFSDFFHPGLEALAYSRARFRAFSFCWAQTFDQYDFTRRMLPWMMHWEEMALSIYSKVFVANGLLKELMCARNPAWSGKIEVVGLPFDSGATLAVLGRDHAAERDIDVIFTSRLDPEKRPEFFLDVAERLPKLRFAISSPKEEKALSLEPEIERRLKCAENVTLHTAQDKQSYYGLLSRSKVQMNAALQDWTSFTLLEALTFGCLPCYPMHRSFPETFDYDERFLYNPNDPGSAAQLILELTSGEIEFDESLYRILAYNDGALGRIAKGMETE